MKLFSIFGIAVIVAATPAMAQISSLDPELEDSYLTQRHGADWKDRIQCQGERCVITSRVDEKTTRTSICDILDGKRYCMTPPTRAANASTAGMTGPQQNAVRTARDYLDMSGFSRRGLIEQLSSEYGEKYAVADATTAVDSLNVDWNEQAVRSAQDYLNMSGFSCQGLIDQLSSDAGEKYTASQAAYGARQAGAC